ncbi:ATP-binding protein [Paraeggerthella sp. LCP19S3_G8]|uniref:ATP-binding protein n=1 Tax=Paraeggerthella sp. LCP19S3_G8 TaxID=3440248 RepID=UPI003F9E749C
MMSLASTLGRFEAPRNTPEQEAAAAAWKEGQRRLKVEERLARSGVPSRYRSASLDGCDRRIADWSASPSDVLLLRGDVGRGKTHAACAVLIANAAERTVLFATSLDLLRDFRSVFDGAAREADVMGRYRNVGLLAVDDLGKERPTDWALSKLFDVLDARIRQGKPTIVTTQYRSAELAARMASDGNAETAKAIVSRLGDRRNAVVAFDGPDRRLRNGR